MQSHTRFIELLVSLCFRRSQKCVLQSDANVGNGTLAHGSSTMRGIATALTVLTAVMLATAPARAQEAYPSRLVRIVVPYPAGGGTDTLARLLADQLGRKWGQSAIVENVGGAAGNIGAAEVARAAPDGYTLLVTSPGPI